MVINISEVSQLREDLEVSRAILIYLDVACLLNHQEHSLKFPRNYDILPFHIYSLKTENLYVKLVELAKNNCLQNVLLIITP